MGCFADCFGTSKRRNHPRRGATKTSPCPYQRHAILETLPVIDVSKQSQIINPINPPRESKGVKERGKLNVSGRKKVTFDLNLRVYELSKEEATSNPEENREKGEKTEETAKASHSLSDSSSSSLTSYPPNYRYQNCRDSDDECDEILDDDTDLDDGEGKVKKDEVLIQESSSESLFSLSIDSRKEIFATEIGDKEVNSPILVNNFPNEGLKLTGSDHNAQVESSNVNDLVLNPVENIAQWKAVKARVRTASQHHQAKENINFNQNLNIHISEEPSVKPSINCPNLNFARLRHLDYVVAVDTSLSSWLVEAEGTPKSNTSSVSVGNSSPSGRTTSFEDRPILGALTVEEIRQFSASSSPRRSPSRSPDDMPIVGSAGSYWSHTGQTTADSDSGSYSKRTSRKSPEDRMVNWNPTPFETRLEMALQKNTAET